MELNSEHPLIAASKRLIDARIPHAKYLEAVKRVWSNISVAAEGEVVVCVGPSRVGKTRAIHEALSNLLPATSEFDDIQSERNRPVLSLKVRNTGKGGLYKSKYFYSQALARQQHPYYGIADEQDQLGRLLAARIRDTSEESLVEAFSQTLLAENTKFLVIDEIQHLKYMEGGERTATRMLDSWKTVAEDNGLILVLAGAYPVLDILDGSPHMLGRTLDHQFPRYRANDEDEDAFCEVLDTIEALVPWEGMPLGDHYDFLRGECLGCVGLLLVWVRKSLGLAAASGRERLTIQDLELARRNAGATKAILAEIEDGERRWEERSAVQTSEPDDYESHHEKKPVKRANSGGKKGVKKKARPFRAKPRNYPKGNRS